MANNVADVGKWSLKGKTALVTGAAKGMGHAIVEELAGFGATIHICDLTEEAIEKCLKDWKEKGYTITGSVCDASVPAERKKLIATVSTVFNGKLDILVNNVGTAIFKDALILPKRITPKFSPRSSILATIFQCLHTLS